MFQGYSRVKRSKFQSSVLQAPLFSMGAPKGMVGASLQEMPKNRGVGSAVASPHGLVQRSHIPVVPVCPEAPHILPIGEAASQAESVGRPGWSASFA